MNFGLKDEMNDSVDAMLDSGCLAMGPRWMALCIIAGCLIAWAIT